VVGNESPAKLPPLPASDLSQQPAESGWTGLAQRFRMWIGTN
jgi:hypothetical protein